MAAKSFGWLRGSRFCPGNPQAQSQNGETPRDKDVGQVLQGCQAFLALPPGEVVSPVSIAKNHTITSSTGADVRAPGGLAFLCPARPELAMVEQVQQQFSALMQKGAFEPIRRFLTGVDADDRLAEGIAMTYETALRKAEQGAAMDDALVVYAARLRAIEIRREFVKGRQPRRDAMHRANYTDGRTEVLHLDGFEGESGAWPREGDVGLAVAWSSALTDDPTERIVSALDVGTWLGTLDAQDRVLLAGRVAGMTLSEIAVFTNRSISSVFSRLRDLGADLARHSDLRVARRPRSSARARSTQRVPGPTA